jgi:hypothetical protein
VNAVDKTPEAVVSYPGCETSLRRADEETCQEDGQICVAGKRILNHTDFFLILVLGFVLRR